LLRGVGSSPEPQYPRLPPVTSPQLELLLPRPANPARKIRRQKRERKRESVRARAIPRFLVRTPLPGVPRQIPIPAPSCNPVFGQYPLCQIDQSAFLL